MDSFRADIAPISDMIANTIYLELNQASFHAFSLELLYFEAVASKSREIAMHSTRDRVESKGTDIVDSELIAKGNHGTIRYFKSTCITGIVPSLTDLVFGKAS